jgi:hypothetical protein
MRRLMRMRYLRHRTIVTGLAAVTVASLSAIPRAGASVETLKSMHLHRLIGAICKFEISRKFEADYANYIRLFASEYTQGTREAEETNQSFRKAFGSEYCSEMKSVFDAYENGH